MPSATVEKWGLLKSIGAFLGALPEAYLETAASGAQIDSALGHANGFTDVLNPFGGGLETAPVFGHQDAYNNGRTSGRFTGNVVNAVAAAGGVQAGFSALSAAGGIGVATTVTNTGRTVVTIVASGGTAAANPALVQELALGLAGITNLMTGDSDGEFCPEKDGDKFRRTADDLNEEFAMREAMSGQGQKIINSLDDPAFVGMEKWQHVHVNPDGTKIVIHYVRDPKTGYLMDFKYK